MSSMNQRNMIEDSGMYTRLVPDGNSRLGEHVLLINTLTWFQWHNYASFTKCYSLRIVF